MTNIYSVKRCAKECGRSNRNLLKAILLKLILALRYICSFSCTLHSEKYIRAHKKNCEFHDAFIRGAMASCFFVELIGCMGLTDLIFAYGILYTLKTAGVLMLICGLYLWLVMDSNDFDPDRDHFD